MERRQLSAGRWFYLGQVFSAFPGTPPLLWTVTDMYLPNESQTEFMAHLISQLCPAEVGRHRVTGEDIRLLLLLLLLLLATRKGSSAHRRRAKQAN